MPALLAIEQSCFGHERFERRYIDELIGSSEADVFVAVVKGMVIGSVMVKHEAANERSHLLSLALLPSEQGKGYSRSMLGLSEDLGRRRGSRSMYLEVREHNAPAIRLYRNAGYAVVTKLADFFGRSEDAWLMTRQL